MLEWIKVIGPTLISWPIVGLIVILLFRRPILKVIDQFTNADIRRAKFGPVEIERELTKIAEQGQQAVSNLNRLTELGAESRLLELEITEGMFGGFFIDEQRERLQKQIEEYRSLTNKGIAPKIRASKNRN
jgi:hypothetical protein